MMITQVASASGTERSRCAHASGFGTPGPGDQPRTGIRVDAITLRLTAEEPEQGRYVDIPFVSQRCRGGSSAASSSPRRGMQRWRPQRRWQPSQLGALAPPPPPRRRTRVVAVSHTTTVTPGVSPPAGVQPLPHWHGHLKTQPPPWTNGGARVLPTPKSKPPLQAHVQLVASQSPLRPNAAEAAAAVLPVAPPVP